MNQSNTAAAMPTLLEKIVAVKKAEVAERSEKIPLAVVEHMLAELNGPSRGFYEHLQKRVERHENAVIAEIKKASPSQGVIRENFSPVEIAQSFERHQAACLSVLTDASFFQGSEVYLEEAREATQLPVIRKDFIIDAYQVYESKAMGADCILLIAACLSQTQMLTFTRLAYDLGMDVLVEVHNLAELDKVAGLPIRMVGINNRDLHTFDVNLTTTFELAAQIPKEILIVTESGIHSREDVELMNTMGIYAFLVGESLMRHDDPGEKLDQLFFNGV
ncbi:indole-3-glycerol phosphate synthase TrpC [Ostreibacterium oceani]|uniref:Indole-3-glycerol phosphate synthase n=1 Tax=Ostreibacterium oceani TaxID=2654998 RepID=A0A6N7EQM3_9GAMM|nr:indole-3-glycerol phosphate synthase TrpC [Ostreibacterium oceani]MPV85154.1 indole-3-glycerol phosphate synthase TrpC [Ostreibacterium oceani]